MSTIEGQVKIRMGSVFFGNAGEKVTVEAGESGVVVYRAFCEIDNAKL